MWSLVISNVQENKAEGLVLELSTEVGLEHNHSVPGRGPEKESKGEAHSLGNNPSTDPLPRRSGRAELAGTEPHHISSRWCWLFQWHTIFCHRDEKGKWKFSSWEQWWWKYRRDNYLDSLSGQGTCPVGSLTFWVALTLYAQHSASHSGIEYTSPPYQNHILLL